MNRLPSNRLLFIGYQVVLRRICSDSRHVVLQRLIIAWFAGNPKC